MDPPTWHSEQKATVEAAADTGLRGGHLVTPQLAAPSGTPREATECKPSDVLKQPPQFGTFWCHPRLHKGHGHNPRQE